jgi:hypothetical protein
VTNTSTIISGEVVSEFFCSKIYENISIPRFIRGDVKEMFIGEVGIDGGIGSIGGESRDEFGEGESFLALGC